MTIVIDANLVVALALPLPYADLATAAISHWIAQGEQLIAPMLMEYELTTAIRRGVASGRLREQRALPILYELRESGVQSIAPTAELHEQALYWAGRVSQHKAYDAQYLALAAREDAPFWTADRRLAAATQDAGLEWVHWIGDWNDATA